MKTSPRGSALDSPIANHLSESCAAIETSRARPVHHARFNRDERRLGTRSQLPDSLRALRMADEVRLKASTSERARAGQARKCTLAGESSERSSTGRLSKGVERGGGITRRAGDIMIGEDVGEALTRCVFTSLRYEVRVVDELLSVKEETKTYRSLRHGGGAM